MKINGLDCSVLIPFCLESFQCRYNYVILGIWDIFSKINYAISMDDILKHPNKNEIYIGI
jgi:hypothetical protein